jgi:hypothetical protein
MIQEQKELLLKDLCGRLPYGVIIEHEGNLSELDTIFMCDSISISSTSIDKKLSYNLDLDEVKPYLFPLTSMTEEQKLELTTLKTYVSLNKNREYLLFDWLNANYFDYRGLIPMGLANDATGLNIY